jgi:hypothetical protein
MTDIRYTSQRLSSKPITHNPFQILKLTNLTRRKPFTQNRQVLFLKSTPRKSPRRNPDPMPIVGDLKELQTAFFDQDIDLCGSCVDGVFDEFFECVRGTLDYFPRSDFVHDLRRQRVSCGTATRDLFVETLYGAGGEIDGSGTLCAAGRAARVH